MKYRSCIWTFCLHSLVNGIAKKINMSGKFSFFTFSYFRVLMQALTGDLRILLTLHWSGFTGSFLQMRNLSLRLAGDRTADPQRRRSTAFLSSRLPLLGRGLVLESVINGGPCLWVKKLHFPLFWRSHAWERNVYVQCSTSGLTCLCFLLLAKHAHSFQNLYFGYI